jgi:NADPH-dependent 2,4-dienoyl-CoA reductase/sulfur reductase-like enzyme/rhodanese-related sulfurtransferase
MKVVIIGGVAGGASAATRLRRLDERAEIILVERGQFVSYANCGLPYYVGNVIKERERLLVQTAEGLSQRFNIDVRVKQEAVTINPQAKTVDIVDIENNRCYSETYDKLILSPGAEPIRPPIPGIESPKIFTLRTVPDTFAITEYIQHYKPRHAVVVGGGFIGLEMAENLAHRRLQVSVAEASSQVMAPLDPEMAATVHQYLKAKGISLYLGDGVKEFHHQEGTSVILQSGTKLPADLVLLAIGVRPESGLAKAAGLELGDGGAIKVNHHLQTSNPDIYALGDAIQVTDLVSNFPARIPLAGPANKQGRIAANHIAGLPDSYHSTQGTAIVKLFDLTVAATGNNEKQLKKANIPYMKSYTHSSSHSGYYPGSSPMIIKLLFSPTEGKLLGAQIVGYKGVDKRIDVLAASLRTGLTVFQLQELELAYAPPFSSAKDPANMAGFVASNIITGLNPVIHWDEIDQLDPQETLLLDTRTQLETQFGQIPRSLNIPLDDLRANLHQLPQDKEIIIYCEVGLRGYLAARILLQQGFKVRNLSGGYRLYRLGKGL